MGRAALLSAMLWALALGLGVAPACERAPTAATGGDALLRIVVSVAPLTSLAAELAPPGSDIATLVPPGRSLHSYEITPADLARLGRADVVVYVGLGLDPKVAEFLEDHPSGRTVVCFADVVGIKAAEASDGHSHDAPDAHDAHDPHDAHDEPGDDHHDHGAGVDPHLWLDPSLVAQLIPAIRAGIEAAQSRRGPVAADEMARLQRVQGDLLARVEAMDQQYAASLRPLAGRAIVTHHDAFRRVADRYGLRIAAVIRPVESAEPTPGAIAAAAGAAREAGAGAVFFEPQFDPASARRIAEAAGAKLASLDPEGDTDWFRLMRSNLDSLVANLGD